ncbi:MAG: hypothetical protein OEW31_11615 [Thermoleophilia bacterium]|nr:hypothetical protein [Thermoleophilia bacterium]MDH4346972.1 hypothetical protein [Thermoleophilia bacterium]MDH5334098.1 hypothetical protein [Thermoleophilia bacterium]
MARAAAVVIATLAALLAFVGASGAGVTPDTTLLSRYAPILTLHPQERLSPVAVDGYLADSDLTVKAAGGTWVPTVIPLETAPEAARLDQRLCRASDGPDAASCYAAAQAVRGTTPTTYGAVFRSNARIALQYWLFYTFNPYEQLAPQGRFWQAHEGDWEAVTVLLDRAERPLLVGLSRHCAGVRRSWTRTPRRSTHPLVYVALGSHANYFGPATRPLDRVCWPPEALAVYDAYGVTLVDRTARGRVVRPRVVRITARSPAWMRYRGAWGETQYVGFPNVDPLAFGSGPAGPAFHDLWRTPVATPLAWPPG